MVGWSPDVKVTSSVAVSRSDTGSVESFTPHNIFVGTKEFGWGRGIAAARDNSNPPAAPKRSKLCISVKDLHILHSTRGRHFMTSANKLG